MPLRYSMMCYNCSNCFLPSSESPSDMIIEVNNMIISYKKLWKLLIDRDTKKKDLQKTAGISSASITKLGKNENVNTEI